MGTSADDGLTDTVTLGSGSGELELPPPPPHDANAATNTTKTDTCHKDALVITFPCHVIIMVSSLVKHLL